ncbi:phage-related protein [Methanobacterium formicicum]|uniref:Phage-related protein n=1 Tax=Methanobacterium formicicum TaxID=2162 RepID=A0A089ZVI2_METFO|nr:phage-related protein [Methanobacterium formicicum]
MKTQLQQSKQLLNVLKQNYDDRLAAETQLANELSSLFFATEKQILKNLKSHDEIPANFYSIISPLDDLRVVYSQLIAQINEKHFIQGYGRNATLIKLMEAGFNLDVAAKALTIDRGDDFFGIDEATRENIKNKSFVASQGVMDRVNQGISKNLAQSYNDGVGIDNAARSLQQEFSKLKGYEATRIARTEINSAQNEGAFQAYYDFDIKYHQWWTGRDARVRDSHRAIHAQITKVGSKFTNGLTRPGDRSGPKKEWIHCRCTTIPYLMPLGMMAPPGETAFFEKDLIPIPGFDQDIISYHPYDSHNQIVKSNIRRTRELRTELGRKQYNGTMYKHGETSKDYVTIYNVKGDRNPFISQDDVYQQYMDLPKKIRDNVKSIFIENSSIIKRDGEVLGFARPEKGWFCLLKPSNYPNPSQLIKEQVFAHEAAHLLDTKTIKYVHSYSREYRQAVRADMVVNGGEFPSNYAKNFFINNYENNTRASLREDFAESVQFYLNPETDQGMRFRRLFPNRVEYLRNLLGEIV